MKASENPRVVGETFVVVYKSGESRSNTLEELSDLKHKIKWSFNGATNPEFAAHNLPQETDGLSSTIRLTRVTATNQTFMEWTVDTRSASSAYFLWVAKSIPSLLAEIGGQFSRRDLLTASDGNGKRPRSESTAISK